MVFFLSNYHYYREEIEKPEIWAQICIQRMVELAKESTTMRRVLDPMFVDFDSRQHWAPQNGLAMMVLSSMAYFMENTGVVLNYFSEINHSVDVLSHSIFYLQSCAEFRTSKQLSFEYAI